MAEKELRVAVVGMGKLGLLHASTLNALPGCRLVAISDTAKTVLKTLEARIEGLETFTDHAKLLDQVKPDLVAIATPTGLHVPIAIDCVERGVHVFIEKPLSITGEQARPLLRALAQKPVVNMVGYMTRFLPTYRKAKGLIQSGALGRLQMLRSSMYIGQLFGAGKGWRYDKKLSGGGVLTTQNSHLVDLLLWYFGDVNTVSAHVSHLYSKDVEDHAHLVLGFDGFAGYLDASWSARHFRTPTMGIHVQGENGTLDVDDDNAKLWLANPAGGLAAGWHSWNKPDLYVGVPFDIGGSNYTEQAIQFLDAIREGGGVESDVRSAHKVQCVIDAAYRSAGTKGAPVAVEYSV